MKPLRPATRRKLEEAEASHRLGWYYLSFATEYQFLGAAVVQARGPFTAETRCRELKIHPGGHVIVNDLNWRDLKRIPEKLRNRLLSQHQVLLYLEGTPL